MRSIATALFALLFGSPGAGAAKDSETKTIRTPDGQVIATSTPVDPVPQNIVAASAQQIADFNVLASKAGEFVSTYLPGVSNPSIKQFDDAFSIWQRETRRTYTEQEVIEILGARLGGQVVAELEMEWVVVTDQYGTDFAVRAKKHEVMAFPFSSVAKRIERNQYEFMVGIYRTVLYTMKNGDIKAR